MKTKTYEFTQDEVLALRNATCEYYHQTKKLKPNSPIAIRMYKCLKALKEQFGDDYRLWKH